MIYKKMLVISLLFTVCTLLAYAEEHAREAELVPAVESPFAYRKGPAISLGAGANTYALGDLELTLPNVALELGYGFNERILASVDANALLPRIGIGVRYFLKSPEQSSFMNKLQPFVNIGFASFDLNVDFDSEEIAEDARLSYVVLTAGVGYQPSRYLLTDVSVSLTRFNNVINVVSFAAMAKVILW